MDSLWQHVRRGIRHVRRSPGFATIIVVMLAFSIGANSALFGIVNVVPLLFRVAATDPRVFAGAPALLIAISLLATLLPARPVAHAAPLIVLRSE
ncbi:MAG TPA: hypothetical protein VFW98_10600 [Gemmatimonadaceae bacterium]|nr:hypothetical protein [Gemmatimonadaceae bacterium]